MDLATDPAFRKTQKPWPLSPKGMTRCSHGREPMDRGPPINAKSRRDDRSDDSCRPVGASDAGVCPVTMGSRPWLPHAVPLGLNTFRRDIIASSRNAATLHLAATRRQDVAMGVSPWTALSNNPQTRKLALKLLQCFLRDCCVVDNQSFQMRQSR